MTDCSFNIFLFKGYNRKLAATVTEVENLLVFSAVLEAELHCVETKTSFLRDFYLVPNRACRGHQ